MSIPDVITSNESHPDDDCLRVVDIMRRACIKIAAEKYKAKIIIGYENKLFTLKLEGHEEQFSHAKECACWLQMAEKLFHHDS